MSVSKYIDKIYKEIYETRINQYLLEQDDFLWEMTECNSKIQRLCILYNQDTDSLFFDCIYYSEYEHFIEWVGKQNLKTFIEVGFTYHELLELNNI